MRAADTATQTGQTTAHPFAHLGPAPYRFVGMFRMPVLASFGMNSAGYNAALADLPKLSGGYGSCSHCATCITYVYVVQCGDGSRWGVGCDCIMKLDGTSNKTLVSAVKKAKQAEDKKNRHAKEELKIEDGRQWLADHETELADIPHPNTYRASKGDTYLDYVNFCIKQSGVSGTIRMIQAAKKQLAEVKADREMEARTDEYRRAEAETAMNWL